MTRKVVPMARMTRRAAAVTAIAVVIAGGAGAAAVAVATEDREVRLTGADLERASEAAIEEVGPGRVTGAERDDDGSRYEVEVSLESGGEVDVHLDDRFRVLGTETDDADDADDAADDRDERLTGADLERASEAALAEVGPGRVTDAERDDDGSGYEVEVSSESGREVDVHLDDQFRVVATEDDDVDGTDDVDDDDSLDLPGDIDGD
jgi:uncharacterized membrane protein YkoI